MNESVFDQQHLTVVGMTVLTVLLVVLVHYEVLSFLNRNLPRFSHNPRPRILGLMIALLVTHIVEIWMFAGSYLLLGLDAQFGQLVTPAGTAANSLFEYVYFSAVTYSTLGFGDIFPLGHVRFLVGTEALSGLLLITWSASFTFLEMQRFWRN